MPFFVDNRFDNHCAQFEDNNQYYSTKSSKVIIYQEQEIECWIS